MAEICINENDIKSLIESYKRENNSFNLYSYSELKGNKRVCKFFTFYLHLSVEIFCPPLVNSTDMISPRLSPARCDSSRTHVRLGA